MIKKKKNKKYAAARTSVVLDNRGNKVLSSPSTTGVVTKKHVHTVIYRVVTPFRNAVLNWKENS